MMRRPGIFGLPLPHNGEHDRKQSSYFEAMAQLLTVALNFTRSVPMLIGPVFRATLLLP